MARAALGEWIAARAGGIRAARRVGVRLDHRARRAWWRAAGPLGNSALGSTGLRHRQRARASCSQVSGVAYA